MILFTHPDIIPNEATIINALFEEGLEALHLRKPDWEISRMEALLSAIDVRFHSRIMVHSHYELRDAYHIKGLHFTGQTRGMLPDFEGVKCAKSMSLHSLEELDLVSQFIDYVFLSPLFPSVSKPGYSGKWDFEELQGKLQQKRHFKVVALGGITLDNKNTVRELGFDDFALLGSIWEPIKSGVSMAEVESIFKITTDRQIFST